MMLAGLTGVLTGKGKEFTISCTVNTIQFFFLLLLFCITLYPFGPCCVCTCVEQAVTE